MSHKSPVCLHIELQRESDRTEDLDVYILSIFNNLYIIPYKIDLLLQQYNISPIVALIAIVSYDSYKLPKLNFSLILITSIYNYLNFKRI